MCYGTFGVIGPATKIFLEGSGILWKEEAERVIPPYAKPEEKSSRHLSSAGHEKSCVN